MKKTISTLAVFFGFVPFCHCADDIQDNSYFIEEAYNQETGVIQHIQNFMYLKTKNYAYSFTEEWPVGGQTHQLSVTVPINHIDADGAFASGVGDIALNYRYQLVFQ